MAILFSPTLKSVFGIPGSVNIPAYPYSLLQSGTAAGDKVSVIDKPKVAPAQKATMGFSTGIIVFFQEGSCGTEPQRRGERRDIHAAIDVSRRTTNFIICNIHYLTAKLNTSKFWHYANGRGERRGIHVAGNISRRNTNFTFATHYLTAKLKCR